MEQLQQAFRQPLQLRLQQWRACHAGTGAGATPAHHAQRMADVLGADFVERSIALDEFGERYEVTDGLIPAGTVVEAVTPNGQTLTADAFDFVAKGLKRAGTRRR